MAPLWTSDEAAAATGGRATRTFAATGLSIDSRSIARGELFVALQDQRDGHDFVAAALNCGAAAALVSRVPPGLREDAPLLLVPEVLPALAALARAGRARTAARVVAVTGSVGKTSTKEMLRAVLSSQGPTHAAEASFNNHWGVPLTLARLPRDARFAVIEIGMNHPGEIAPLARLARPHAALITTVGAAHLAAFDGIEAIAREKAAVFEGLSSDGPAGAGLARGGIAVIPSGLAVTPILEAAAAARGARILRFGAAAGDDWRLERVQLAGDVTVAQAAHGRQRFSFKVMTAGRHFAMNALGVLALADALGCDPAMAALDLARWVPPAGRGAREKVQLDLIDEAMSFDLIDDAFNANPDSMNAALEVLASARPRDGIGRVKRGRRIAVLGDMLELGPDEVAAHAALARHPAMAAIDVVHCAGPLMHALWTALPRARRGEWHESAHALAWRAQGLADAGDIVLVKGSKGSKVSLVVDGLRKLGQREPGAGGAGERGRL